MSFDMGAIVITRAINNLMIENRTFAKELLTTLRRYMNCDWGDMCQDDKELNDSAVNTGLDRILAAYETSVGKVYIITEHDRTRTTIEFTSEY